MFQMQTVIVDLVRGEDERQHVLNMFVGIPSISIGAGIETNLRLIHKFFAVD